MENCSLEGCDNQIPYDRHKNATTCCHEHALLKKKQNDKANYQKVRNTAYPIIKLREHLYYLAYKFGFEVLFDLAYALPFNINWAIKTGTFQRDGAQGVALGDIGYIIYKPQSIKIFQL